MEETANRNILPIISSQTIITKEKKNAPYSGKPPNTRNDTTKLSHKKDESLFMVKPQERWLRNVHTTDYLFSEPYVTEHVWDKIEVEPMNVVITGWKKAPVSLFPVGLCCCESPEKEVS